MALPIISVPEFEDIIPSTGQPITFRPFLVKEEKILYMALEGNNTNDTINAVTKALQNCIISPVDIDVNKLASFDVEYLFLKLRSKSVGEVIELKLSHKNVEGCNHIYETDIRIDDIVPPIPTNDKNIMIDQHYGVRMKYPSINLAKSLKNGVTPTASDTFSIIAKSIELIYDDSNVYDDFTEQEMLEWVESLSEGQFRKITQFFDTLPKLSHTVEWVCPVCKQKDTVVIEGLQNFFM